MLQSTAPTTAPVTLDTSPRQVEELDAFCGTPIHALRGGLEECRAESPYVANVINMAIEMSRRPSATSQHKIAPEKIQLLHARAQERQLASVILQNPKEL